MRWRVVVALAAGYVGIYLCRKNLAVAIPLLSQDPTLHLGRSELGRVASIGTLTYAAGKLLLGPLADRIGGRKAFLLSMVTVALFGALGGFVPGLFLLTAAHGLNRFFGAGGWPAMMKLVPSWFEKERIAFVAAALSLSYVLGGIAATLFAREMVRFGWRAVLAAPSLVLLVITVVCALIVHPGPREVQSGAARSGGNWTQLLVRPQFLVVLVLSFTLTMLRESFNVWSVDFLMSVQGKGSIAAAALQSTTFDLAGAASILSMGVIYDRVPPRLRRWLIAGILMALGVLLLVLPGAAQASPTAGAWLIGAVGLLVYGPYSLLAGVLAVESGGAELAASASGVIDAVGYLAGVLSGEVLGRIVDAGGYKLGFECLAALAALSAICASRLGRSR